jgi:hypothetical protein
MKKLIPLLFFPASLIAQGGNSWGTSLTQDEILGQMNSISTGVPFLRIAPDARAGGMGDRSVALSNDANAMFWNPSRLAFNEPQYGIAVSYNPWLRALVPDLNHFYAAGYYKPDSVSAIGVSFTYFSMGNFSAGGLPIVRLNEMAADVAYSRKFRKNFSGGLTARYFHSANYPVYGSEPKGWSMDFGLTWVGDQFECTRWNGHLQSGLAITNIGPKIYYGSSANKDFLPTNFALAFGGEFEKDQKHFIAFQIEVNKLLVPSPPIYAIDSSGNPIPTGNGGFVIAAGKDPNRSEWEGMVGSFNDSPDGAQGEFREIMWSTGVEYDYKHIVKGRTGFFYEHALNGDRQYVTFGIGARYQNLAFDVSYLFPVNAQWSPLQNTMKFTLIVNS